MSKTSTPSEFSTTNTETFDNICEIESFTTETENSSQISNEISSILSETGTKGRQLKADDDNWAVCPVPYLERICLQSISDNIMKLGIEETRRQLNEEQWEKLMNILSLELPVNFMIPHLDNNIYWKRCCESLWMFCDEHKHGGNWRRMFVEKTVNEAIENFQPNVTDILAFNKTLKICKDYILSIDIRQWNAEKELPMESNKENEEGEEEIQMPKTYAPVNHIDVGRIFQRFPNLQEVNLCSCPRKCGLTFEVEEFILSLIDIKRLSQSLQAMPMLKKFCLYGTWMNHEYVRILVKALLNHQSLNYLGLSYDMMTETCGIYFAGLLMNTCPLKSLILGNNSLGNDGATAIGISLIENNILETLDLKLNGIDDESGAYLIKCIQLNSTLKHLILCGNRFGPKTGVALAKLIETSKSLLTLDVSSNSLGAGTGISIKEAMEKNTTLKKLDVRLCDLGEDTDLALRKLELRNSHLSLLQYL